MRKLSIILIMLPLLFVSCDEKQLNETLVGCYFQYEYVNYAWGFSHSGFTITPDGEVFSFDKSTPWAFADNNKLTLLDLRKNIAASVKVDTLITKTDIEHYTQLAFLAMSGKLSDTVSRGADMGERICKIIVPDASDLQNGYREIILTEDGDFERHNLSPDAVTIAEWLSKLRIN